VAASAGYNVGGLLCCLPVMRQVLAAGLLTVGMPAVEFLQRRFAESSDSVERAGAALLLGEFGAEAAGVVPLLAAVLADPDPGGGLRLVRVGAASTLRQLRAATGRNVAGERVGRGGGGEDGGGCGGADPGGRRLGRVTAPAVVLHRGADGPWATGPVGNPGAGAAPPGRHGGRRPAALRLVGLEVGRGTVPRAPVR